MFSARIVSIIVLIFIGLSVSGGASAQTRAVRNFTTQDGLPSIEVFHILQDRDGFIWFSTSNGIASFDGHRVKAFSVDDGVPDPLVLETQQDAEGRIWMRSFSGRIGYHLDNAIYPYVFNDSLSKFCSLGFMEAFAQDSTGKWLYFENNDHFATIDSTGAMHTSVKLGKDRIQISRYSNKLVMQSTIGEFAKHATVAIDGKDFPIEIPNQDSKYSHTHYSAITWRNSIYFSFKNYLFRYDGQRVERVLMADAVIINLSVDKRDRFYVGYMNHGAVEFNDEFLQHGDTLSFTRGYSVTDVLQDHEGGLWVSTVEAGVFYESFNSIRHHTLEGNHRIKTTLMHRKKILIGTYDGLLVKIDEKSGQREAEHKFDRTVMALHALGDTLFVGTSNQLAVLKDFNGSPIHEYHGNVQGFFERDNYVIALTNRALFTYSRDGRKLSRTHAPRWIRSVYVTDSSYYAITHLGMELYDRDFNRLARPRELEQLKISQLHVVNDSLLLIGTLGSGLMVSDHNFTRITNFQSLPSDIYSIISLGNHYYFASEQGIFRISLEDVINRTSRALSLSSRNGLLNKSISMLSKTSDGKLVVFYDRSFSLVDPSVMDNLNQSPRFYLSKISVNNGKMKQLEQYRLPYDSNTIQLEFGFVSFNNQDFNIRYRLHSDDSWIYPDRTNVINLYSLAPGLYRPEIEYSVDRHSWQYAGVIPAIHIAYPWWLNPYLQLLVFIVICVVGAVIIRNRIIIVRNRLEIQHERNERLKILTEQQQQLIDTEKLTTDRERNRIAKDLHDSVGASLLATKLSVGRILKRYNHLEAGDIEEQLTNTLNEIKNIIYDLSPAELERDGFAASIKNYVDKLSGVTDIRLEVSFYGDDITNGQIITPVFRILQELLSNSIKYSNGDAISIHINSFSTLLNIVYEDNGIGFSPVASKGIGKGLLNIETRVTALNGKLKIDSGDYGTCFIMDIPKVSVS